MLVLDSATVLVNYIEIIYNQSVIGMWPSGKALVSGTSIRGFESLHPSHEKVI